MCKKISLAACDVNLGSTIVEKKNWKLKSIYSFGYVCAEPQQESCTLKF